MRKQGQKKPRIVSETEDFRVYEDEWLHEADGCIVVVRKCEEFVRESGRWEPFYSTVLILNPDGSVKFSRLGLVSKTIDTTASNN